MSSTLEDALALVAERAALVQAQPGGSMLAVRLPEQEVLPYLGSQLAIAAINSPTLCVVSGPDEAVAELATRLKASGVVARRLSTSHAFHSSMMEPVLAPFAERLRRVSLGAPAIPYVSNVTARWVTEKETTSPEYWTRHIRQTVRFADGLDTLCGDAFRVFLEVGPGNSLGQLVRQHPARPQEAIVLASLRVARGAGGEAAASLETAGRAWLAGVPVDWRAVYANERRTRVPLPTYPFEPRESWLDPPSHGRASTRLAEPLGIEQEPARETSEVGSEDRVPDDLPTTGDVEPDMPARPNRIADRLRRILFELSGVTSTELETSATFLEMGFDSLFLAEFSRRLENEFGVAVDFGQLATELATLVDLSAHLDRELAGKALTNDSTSDVSLMGGADAAVKAQDQSATSHIVERLHYVLEGLSGMSRSELSSTATFLEMGFDSLFVAEFSRKIEGEFGVSLSFDQLADATLGDLAGKLEQSVSSQAPHVSLSDPSRRSAPQVDNALVEALQEQVRSLTEQVHLLSKQLSAGETDDVGAASLPASTPQLEPEEISLPLTAGQREIWLASNMSQNASRAYNEVVVIRLQGNLNVTVLQASIQKLVSRHDALRGTITPDGDRQVIHPRRLQQLPLVDLSALPSARRELRLQELTDRYNRTLFDLINGPFMEAGLVRLSEEDHVLHLVFHHVFVDGWSTHVIVSELSRLYTAGVQGGDTGPAPPMQYRDYVQWYYAPETVTKRDMDEQYWVKSFADLPASVELPTRGPRPAERSYRAGNASLMIDADLYRRLKKASAESGCTLFHFLLATFSAWLQPTTGQTDIVVGVPIAGHLASNLQRMSGCDQLVGHAANIVPIRMDVGSGVSFADFFDVVKRKVLDARAHEGFTYGELLEKLHPPRDSSRVPFVSVTLNLNDTPAFEWEDLVVEVEVPPLSCIFFDLEVNIWESADGLRIDCYYADDLFDLETVTSWLAQWKRVMTSAAENPAGQLDRLELIGQDERHRLLVEWNSTEAAFPRQSDLADLFEGQVERSPEAVAVVAGGVELSYRQLNAQANQLAHYLQGLGVGPGALVGVFVERSASMVVGLLGVLKAGAAYVPLDPIYPADRIAYVLADAGAAVVLTEEQLEGALGSVAARVVCLDREGSQVARASTENPARTGGAEAVAYVIYTSGSTGKPKGVEIEHRALVNFLTSMQREPGMEAADRLLAVTTLSFDIAGLELFLPLVTGARVILVPWQTAADGQAWRGRWTSTR